MDITTPQPPSPPPPALPVAAPAPVASAPVPPPPPSMPTSQEQPKGMFPWKTILLILVLLGVTGGLVYIALSPKLKPQLTNIQPTPTVSPAHTTLSLVQNAATASGTPSLAVHINTNTNKVTGVQFEIAYDPTLVTNVSITQGDFLPQPTVLLNGVDIKNGRISYAIVLSPTAPAITGAGTVATISYSLSPATPASKSTTFTFLPKTKVTQDNIVSSVLQQAIPLTIPLPTPTK